ncbi:toluene hydroxylase [Pseudonocardia endophytica]|uniref:propane 2-monooxygenase n=1 Tax=Pseudonocardia endophytica TaxID=401976 RepID=A0A4R1I148_PSEEN|nr:toluene hydroxylase [Pseudonocardia endophytica]TCK27623.1 toluene monooxygenase system protein E [Pseudonocardia endophytica]
MTETPATPKRRLRTWSAFGDVKRRPSEYEIVTHRTNWTLRPDRKAPLEGNPSSPGNLWLLTYRDQSPLQVPDWDDFRDPDAHTYRSYVIHQDQEEGQVAGLLDQYATARADTGLSPAWVRTLAELFTPSRFPLHGSQQVEAYIGYVAPSSYITNPAALAAADLLRRVTLVSYRTRELQIAHPDSGFATGERAVWEHGEAWQPARRAVELALVAYDWAEAFTALNLVLLPTLDDVLLRQLGDVARDNGDEQSWLLGGRLAADSDRRMRWSGALARYALENGPGNAGVLRKWIGKWSPRADDAAAGLGHLLETLPDHGRPASEVADGARRTRERLLSELGLI